MTYLKSAAAMALVLAFPMSANAALLTNGSFETIPSPLTQNHLGSTASWDYFPGGIPGWSTEPGQALEIQSNATLDYIDAQSGNHYAELDSNGNSSFYQDVTLTTGRYLLSFWFSIRDTAPINPGAAGQDTNDISYGVDGLFSTSVAADPSSGFTIGEWTQMTAEFSVASTDTFRIRLSAEGTSDTFGGFVDNIELSPVPVPAAGLMLLSALGAGAMMRRKKA